MLVFGCSDFGPGCGIVGDGIESGRDIGERDLEQQKGELFDAILGCAR